MVRGQWGNLSRMPGLLPYSFSKDILGFLMTTESQDLGLNLIRRTGVYKICTQNPLNILYCSFRTLILHIPKLCAGSFIKQHS